MSSFMRDHVPKFFILNSYFIYGYRTVSHLFALRVLILFSLHAHQNASSWGVGAQNPVVALVFPIGSPGTGIDIEQGLSLC